MTWLIEHFNDLMTAFGYLVSGASVIVGLTKTKKDDSIVAGAMKVLDFVSIVNTAKDREKLEQ